MLPSPLSSLSFSSVSFLQFALALFEQLLVHSLLSLSFSPSLSFTPAFFLSLFFLAPSLSLWQSRFYHVAILFLSNLSDTHIYTLFLFHSIEIFIIESRRDISSDMPVHGDLLRFSLIAVFAARNCT